VAEAYLPAREVGGDFYDLFVQKGKLVLTIADAAGKGISACMYALRLRSNLRTAITLFDDLGEMLVHSNRRFLVDTGNTGMYATVLMGIYDPSLHRLTYYSCGHVPGIIKRANGHLLFLEHTGMALGVVSIEKIVPQTMELFAGDTLLFYTDGLTNAVNEKNQSFSLGRLQALLQQRPWNSAEEIKEGILKEVRSFMGSAVQLDDITLLVMKVQ
jgi:sigma-B regulation protein RsbU (phosphoserine phosphatase)